MISLLVSSDDYKRESIPMQVSSIDIFTLPNGQQQLFMLKKYYSSLDSETALRPYVYEIQQGELLAKWRGSALAWPTLDAEVVTKDFSLLYVKHRSDSYIEPDTKTQKVKYMVYSWNGFGFTAMQNDSLIQDCKDYYTNLEKVSDK